MTPRRWLVLVVAVALVAAVAAVVVVRLRGDDASRFSAALELAPTSTQRYSWTDWAGVREELGVRLSDSSSPEDVDDFLQQAYDRDLSSMTALSESAPTIQQELGFSPPPSTGSCSPRVATARW